MMINGFLGFISIALLFPDLFRDYYSVTALMMLTMCATASTDVLADTLMVVEARKDPARGSEDLYTFSFTTQCLFGAFGALTGAYFTQYVHPRWGLLMYSFFGLSIFIGAIKLREK